MPTATSALHWLADTVCVYETSDLIVHVSGDDARSWLNGQITNDVRELGPDSARYATALTVKGRIVTDLWAITDADGMAVVLPSARAEAALERFEKHIIMEDVELSADRELAVITIQGPRTAELIAQLAPSIRRYACARLSAEGVDCWIPRTALASILDMLSAHARALGGGRVDDAAWAAAHIARGIPRIAADFDENCYPQEAGLGARALSFAKGCYLGQEVVYMLEKRGQLARRLVQLAGPAEAQPERGAAVADADGKRIGEVTSFGASADDGSTLALAYLKRAYSEPEQSVWLLGSPWRVQRVVGAT